MARLLIAASWAFGFVASGVVMGGVVALSPFFTHAPLSWLVCTVLFCATLGCVMAGSGSWRVLVCATALVVVTALALQQAKNSMRDGKLPLATIGAAPGVALVTGSTRGIGHAVARTLLEAGWTVFLHGSSLESMQAAASSLNYSQVTPRSACVEW
jgi:hypothetical protein